MSDIKEKNVADEKILQTQETVAQPLDPEALLEVRNLKKYFPVGEDFFGRPANYLKAVDDVLPPILCMHHR
ncbi:MAG: hypothetical protein IJB97_10840, partial [Clostridia bacterium]|nr:hypothetical protein [Clostridia bacterium]